jgi:bifunctional non-homologous end joining protein LigD
MVKEPFDDPDYIFEMKHDGFRAVAYLQDDECKIISRNQRSLDFESLKKALTALRPRDAIIDAEIVCLDANGVSRFNQLLNRKTEPALCAFDLLWLNGRDLRQLPLSERKDHLARLIRSSECKRILYAQHIEEHGKRFVSEICARDLEGIVAKRKLGIYKDDGNSWVKIKNCAYSQAEGRHELLRH